MTEQKIGTWEGLVATAKTSTWIHNELYYTNSDPQEKWVSLGLVQELQEQWKGLIDSIPIDMQKVGRRYECYSVGAKKQWIDWFVRYNQILGAEG